MSLDTRLPNEPDKVWLYRRWLSQQEAAEYLGVTDRTIRNYVQSGALKGYRMRGSRLVRIDRLEIDKALRRIPTAEPAA